MIFFLLLAFMALIVFGAPTSSSSGKTCFDVIVPVTVTSTNYIWGMPHFETDYDLASFSAAFSNRTFGTELASFVPIIGASEETATYNIASTFCEPLHSSAETVLLASHGLTLDRSYWDSTFQPGNYSFVDYVTDKGYAVFFYDRLGAGKSTKVSGYFNQGTIQVAILEQLVNYIRSGKLTSAAKSSPKKIVSIGHSYGSVLTNALLATKPDIVDAAILTGWGYSFSAPLVVASMQPRIANQLHPEQYGEYDSGNVCCVDIYSCAQIFYQQGNFDVAAAEYLMNRASPMAIMEIMSLGTLNFACSNVTAPVMFLTGEYDSIVCQGYCPDVLLATASALFPKAAGFEINIHPGSGHMINFNHNATGAYEVVTNFLAKHGF